MTLIYHANAKYNVLLKSILFEACTETMFLGVISTVCILFHFVVCLYCGVHSDGL